MIKLKTTLITAAVSLPLLMVSLSSHALMDPVMEKSLVRVCKAVKSNRAMKLREALKSSNLTIKTIVLKLTCNGEDVISFAETHNANKTLAKLQKNTGNIHAIKIAKYQKINVNF